MINYIFKSINYIYLYELYIRYLSISVMSLYIIYIHPYYLYPYVSIISVYRSNIQDAFNTRSALGYVDFLINRPYNYLVLSPNYCLFCRLRTFSLTKSELTRFNQTKAIFTSRTTGIKKRLDRDFWTILRICMDILFTSRPTGHLGPLTLG